MEWYWDDLFDSYGIRPVGSGPPETAVAVPEPPPDEETPKKGRKRAAWYEGWEGYRDLLKRLSLDSYAHPRESALRYLANYPPTYRGVKTPKFDDFDFEECCESLSPAERDRLRRMPQRLALAFYENLVRRSEGLTPCPPDQEESFR